MTLQEIAALITVHDYLSRVGFQGEDLQTIGQVLDRELRLYTTRTKEREDAKRHSQ